MNNPVIAEPPLDCPLCPRLVDFRRANEKLYPDFHNAPVASFGDEKARFLIVGLAPGLKGANQTGRPFTGDYAGDLLYATLEKFGFTRGQYAGHAADGMTLSDAMITNAVRCVPPENKPTGAEANACRPFLAERFRQLPSMRAILCLGKIAHDNTLRAMGERVAAYKFAHQAQHAIHFEGRDLRIFDSYHCSRYNTNTGRLTETMFEAVFSDIRKFLDGQP
ncbi:uracil-DNA glycosylase [Hyphobacterium sp. HN65]|uniref:Type-5 uracil-DNA glycosylase n=1 Tax=Hyphobacterium lacteum TaxID=3116575 RepID=A0ABU7LN69_9PROT|nr:uracil-DNA glycosylase [Hyphobacterium sp. HN65]MEE2525061.1 uracil-DNA glycosylase [Hyphobacterium sp. HN65]